METKLKVIVTNINQRPYILKVTKDMEIKVLYKVLNIPNDSYFFYNCQLLNSNLSFDFYNIKNNDIIACISEDRNRQRTIFPNKAYFDKIKEKARIVDIAQISIDNNPKKFRRFAKLIQQKIYKKEKRKENTIVDYDNPVSPSSAPLPMLWG